MENPARILIVDDEPSITEFVSYAMQKEGYLTEVASNGEDALEKIESDHFDLFILDIMLPGIDGYELCRRIRAKMTTPILFLSARDSELNKVVGLELGADDYLAKPFGVRELIARVRALLRRVHADTEPQREVLEFGELTIDVSGHKVMVSGKEIDLTASEFKLLTTLSRYPGRVYSRMELVEKVLGYDFEGYERTIDSHVKNLRAKIGDNPRNPKWLHTVHGVGYRFEDPTKKRPVAARAVRAHSRVRHDDVQ